MAGLNSPAQQRMLESFAKNVVKAAKSNLSAKKGATALEGTIGYDLIENANGFVVSFKMADYGTFVDKGVKGSGGEILTGRHKGSWGGRRYYQTWQGKRKDSPFAFGKSKGGGLTKAIGKWIKKKGISYKGYTQKTLTMLISRNIYIKGIHGISFLQNALKDNIGNLREDYAIAFKDDFIETAFAAIKKK
jgi:hypothetical protein